MKIEDIIYKIPEKPINKDNFDIEKWCMDNPTDYLNNVKLLLAGM